VLKLSFTFFISYCSILLFFTTNLVAEPFIDSTPAGRLSLSKDGTSSNLDAQSRIQSLKCGGIHTIPQNGFFFSTTSSTLTEFDRSFGVWHHCRSEGNLLVPWGIAGDIPAVGDYDGNGYSDYVVYRPYNSTWYIAYVNAGVLTGTTETIQFGLRGDLPYTIDADGDGKDNIGVLRRNNLSGGTIFLYRTVSGSAEEISFGLIGDQPIFGVKNTLGRDLFSLFRPETGEWFVRALDGTVSSFQFGLPGDIAMGAPILTGSQYTPLVYRPKEASWYMKDGSQATLVPFGSLGSKPSTESLTMTSVNRVQSDIDGDFLSDLVLVRKKLENLVEVISLRSSALSVGFKNPILPAGDYYINSDFDGDFKADFASVKSEAGALRWSLYFSGSQSPVPSLTLFQYGLNGDEIVPADYDGDGRTDLAVTRLFLTESGIKQILWISLASGNQTIAPFYWGLEGDLVLTGDVDGDKRADATVVRKVNGGLMWISRSSDGSEITPFFYGLESDIPHLYDLNGDGVIEPVLERVTDGKKFFFSRPISKTDPAFQWGLEGDKVFSNFSRGLLKSSLGVWRAVGGQGYFFLRNDPLAAINIPFGVTSDQLLIETVTKNTQPSVSPIPSSSPTTTATFGSASTSTSSGPRIACDGLSSVEKQESGFVWKPVADSGGKLVVLFGSGRAGKIGSVSLVQRNNTGDVILETLTFAYNSNGNRPTFRAKKSGSSYPSGVLLVRQDKSGFKECISVSNPGKRVG
jgi:hypothetical protein